MNVNAGSDTNGGVTAAETCVGTAHVTSVKTGFGELGELTRMKFDQIKKANQGPPKLSRKIVRTPFLNKPNEDHREISHCVVVVIIFSKTLPHLTREISHSVVVVIIFSKTLPRPMREISHSVVIVVIFSKMLPHLTRGLATLRAYQNSQWGRYQCLRDGYEGRYCRRRDLRRVVWCNLCENWFFGRIYKEIRTI